MAELFGGRRAVTLADHDFAHGPAPDHRDEVGQMPARIERGEELRPVAGVHLDPVPLAVALPPAGAHLVGDGHDRAPVLSDDLRRHALADLRVGQVVGEDAEVRVRMDVDEPGRNDQAGHVQGLACGRARERLDRHDPPVADPDVGREPRPAGPVDDSAAHEQEIERRTGEHREAGPAAQRRLDGDRSARLEEPAPRNRPRVGKAAMREHATG
jgi:hypothetical protein